MPRKNLKRPPVSFREILHAGSGIKNATIAKQLEWLDLRGAYLQRAGWFGFALIALVIAFTLLHREWVPGETTKIYYPAPLQVLFNAELAHGVRRPTENLIRRAEAGDVSDVKAILSEKKLLAQGYAHLLLFQVAKQSNSSLTGIDLPLAAKYAFDNKEVPTEVQINIELAAFGEVKSVRAIDRYKELKEVVDSKVYRKRNAIIFSSVVGMVSLLLLMVGCLVQFKSRRNSTLLKALQ